MAAAQISNDTRIVVTLIDRHGEDDFDAIYKEALEVHRKTRLSVHESSSLERTS
jgi:hypothetical protein